jgi:hypothetical protein
VYRVGLAGGKSLIASVCQLRYATGDRSAERLAETGAAARQVRSQEASQSRAELLPTITAIQATGVSSLRAIAVEPTAREIPTTRRAGEWSAVQVQRAMEG